MQILKNNYLKGKIEKIFILILKNNYLKDKNEK